MSVLNLSEDMVECPLCMEPLEMDDLNFYPCTCGYQICRFCWHRIRTDENGLCPACRKAYPENPADFKPLSPEELARIKQEKRQKDAQRKQKVTENRKHLANVRVVQKNLVFVVGLSTRLADAETLRKPDYFGKFGKIHKVVINHTTSYAGSQLSHVQGPSASAYVTYQRAEDALRAIQAVNNIHVDGRTLKASLGTTKYCSHFMKNQQCPKPDCMYLHELGDEFASFTKEEMQQGKHQEFEKKLQDHYLGSGAPVTDKNGCINPVCSSNNSSSSSISNSSSTNSLCNGTPALAVCTSSHKRSISGGGKENSAPKSLTLGSEVGSSAGSVVREAWPSLGAPPSTTSTKENKKSKASKSEKNSSSRHSPTEEHNIEKRVTRGSKERERLGHSMSGSCNSVNSTNGSTSSNTNSSSILSSSVGDSLRGLSPVGQDSPVSSSHDSCTSSASTTPPPPCTDPFLHTPPSPPPSDNTSPIPVTEGIDIQNPLDHHHHHHHHHHHNNPASPLTTPPSSLSSSSEPSSSLPPPQGFPDQPQGFPDHHSITPPTVPTVAAPQTNLASAAASLFSDNSNSFFSSGPSLPLQRHASPPPASSPTPPTTHQQQLHKGLANAHQHSEEVNSTTDWGSKSSEIFSMDSLLSQNRSNSTWNCIFDMDKNEELPGMSNLVDDELGFDPFEETNKALAEDIKIEQKQQEQQRTQHYHHHHYQQQNHHSQQIHHQHQIQQQQLQQQHQQQVTQQHLRSGLKNLMDGFNAPPSGVASRTRLPPPGFNGLSSFNNFPGSNSAGSNVVPPGQQDLNKLPGLPQYLGGLNSAPPGLGAAPSQGNAMRNNTLNGLNGLSIPPGLGGSLMGGTNTLTHGGLGSAPPPHLLTPASLLGMDTTALGGAGPPPGLGLPPKADAFLLKDLENGLRNIFPAISSVSTMNTLNTVNTINSMVGTHNNQQQPQQNPLTNFINMAQQQQQQHQHHQHQHHQHSTQQSLLQQLTMNSLANAHKGWSSSGGACPDLTALDPAIVSSGQLTDSRSDSPPHWMKTMEHLTNDAGPTPPPQLWNNLLPYNLGPATAPAPHTAMPPHTGGHISVGGRGNSGAMWPPTSPPPGFNSISPLHRPNHQQTHKIENL